MLVVRSHGQDANDALSRIKVSVATPGAESNDAEGSTRVPVPQLPVHFRISYAAQADWFLSVGFSCLRLGPTSASTYFLSHRSSPNSVSLAFTMRFLFIVFVCVLFT